MRKLTMEDHQFWQQICEKKFTTRRRVLWPVVTGHSKRRNCHRMQHNTFCHRTNFLLPNFINHLGRLTGQAASESQICVSTPQHNCSMVKIAHLLAVVENSSEWISSQRMFCCCCERFCLNLVQESAEETGATLKDGLQTQEDRSFPDWCKKESLIKLIRKIFSKINFNCVSMMLRMDGLITGISILMILMISIHRKLCGISPISLSKKWKQLMYIINSRDTWWCFHNDVYVMYTMSWWYWCGLMMKRWSTCRDRHMNMLNLKFMNCKAEANPPKSAQVPYNSFRYYGPYFETCYQTVACTWIGWGIWAKYSWWWWLSESHECISYRKSGHTKIAVNSRASGLFWFSSWQPFMTSNHRKNWLIITLANDVARPSWLWAPKYHLRRSDKNIAPSDSSIHLSLQKKVNFWGRRNGCSSGGRLV